MELYLSNDKTSQQPPQQPQQQPPKVRRPDPLPSDNPSYRTTIRKDGDDSGQKK
ncbi:hypothetical protein SAMN05444354_1093 [Stigmatella aurantiaca]|uniref:Uncharacterized protein n=1 Tax=Stigmatella aurantiaca TaxID=41 RepID=A0A1H7TGW5_STIAU|nr:hypothetical protein SAMN05444354_1093 [Stigmatella aurantiaca]